MSIFFVENWILFRAMQDCFFFFFFSYDITIILQWSKSCHKNHMTTRYKNTWLLAHCIMAQHVTMICFSVEKLFTFYGHKIKFKSNMIKRILHSWSFHMKNLLN